MNASKDTPSTPWYARDCVIGTFLSLGSPVAAELAARAGLDWVILDLEHGVGEGEAKLESQLQVLDARRTAPIVRFGVPHPDMVMRALDWGAAGVMVPRAERVAEIEAVIEAAHYAPRGRRGYSYYTRWHGFDMPDAPTRIDPVIIPQIESLEGVEQVEAIAAADGVTAIFAGVGDLTFDLKQRASADAPAMDDCLERIAKAAQAAGKPVGMFLRSLADVNTWRARGFSLFAVDSDIGLIRAGLLALGTFTTPRP